VSFWQQEPDLARFRPILEKYVTEPREQAHAVSVIRLCRALTDTLAGIHPFRPEERGLLEAAALLHDIGHFVDAQNHDRHSQYLILHDQTLAWAPAQHRRWLALIAGGHRRRPDLAEDGWPDGHKRQLQSLIAILRVADALDYTREAAATVVDFGLFPDRCEVRLTAALPVELEQRLAQRSRRFRKIFNRPLVPVYPAESEER